jgi:large subunit ribosomal protein L3
MGLLGKKIGMTQRFDAKGEWVCLGVVQAGPCVVLDVKTPDRDGYAAIQLGFDEKNERRTSKPTLGICSKAKTSPKAYIRELRLTPDELGQFQVGQTVTVGQVFKKGDIIDVIGTARGKGFQGVMKMYHFSGFRGSHGTHEYFRHGGSVGCRLTPGHVHRGKRMPGQMGNRRVTVQNITVHEVLADRNLLVLKGGMPGAPDGYVTVRQAAKRPFRPFALRADEPKVAAPPAEGAASQG